MVYHIFNYRIQGVWYRDSTPYSEAQFSHVMDAIGWRLPANIRVYQDGRRYALTNRIMLERPILTLDPLLLFSSVPEVRVGLHDKVLRRDFTVIRQVGRFVLAEEHGEWPRLYYADGDDASLIQPLELVPLSFRSASDYVRRYHRHNTAPRDINSPSGSGRPAWRSASGWPSPASQRPAPSTTAALWRSTESAATQPISTPVVSSTPPRSGRAGIWATPAFSPTPCSRSAAAVCGRWASSRPVWPAPRPGDGTQKTGPGHARTGIPPGVSNGGY